MVHWSMVHWSIGPLVLLSIGPLVLLSIGQLDYWHIGPLVECHMLNGNNVKLLSERTSGVPPVIFLMNSEGSHDVMPSWNVHAKKFQITMGHNF